MKLLNFGLFTISVALLSLVQVVIPTAKFTKGPPFDTTSLVHPTCTHTYTGFKTHESSWHLEPTSGGLSEHTHTRHPLGQNGTSRLHFGTDTFGTPPHTRHGSPSTMMPGVHEEKFVIPTNTNYTPPPACTQDGVLCLREDGSDHYPTQTHGRTDSDRSHHAEHPEPTHTTHHMSGKRSFPHSTYSNLVHTTAHPDKARSLNEIHKCDGGCPNGFICNTNDGDFGRFCVPDSAMTTVTWTESPTPHNIHPRSGAEGISYRPCLEGCPGGQKCSDLKGFDYLVCIPDKRATFNSRAEETGTPGPVHCTPHTMTWPLGYETMTSCPDSMQPRHYMDGTCLCEPSNPDGISIDMTGPSDTAVPPKTRPPMPHQSPLGHQVVNRDPNPPWHPIIIGPCRLKQGVDQPDSWNGVDMVLNHTRYTCAAGSQPMLLLNGTCDCIPPPTSYGGPGEVTKTFHTTLSTVHRTGRAPLGVAVVTQTYRTEQSDVSSTSTTAYTVTFSVADQGSRPTSEHGTPATLSTPLITTKHRVDMRATETPAPTDCPLQYLSLADPKPSRPDCPIYVTIETFTVWGTVLNKYPSLYEFCNLLKDPVYRAAIPLGVDLQPFKQQLCAGNGIHERDTAVTPTASYTALAEMINSAHPTPTNRTAPIYIQLYAGIADHGGVVQPQYVTVYYPGGLAKFCEWLPEATELPHGVNLQQVQEEYCKRGPKPSMIGKPPKSKRSLPPAQTIDAAHPKPSNDHLPVWIKMGPSDGAKANVIVYAENLVAFCDKVGVDKDDITTLPYIQNPDQVWKGFCQGVPH